MKQNNTTRELRAALNLSSRTYVPVPSPHRMQMQNAECRIGPKAVNCARCRMQMQNAECRISPKAENCPRCRMQMQNAECRISPKAVNCTRCRMQMQNAECRSGPKATAVRDVQDAGCRMRNAKTHPQPGESGQSTDAGCRCRMQKLAQYR